MREMLTENKLRHERVLDKFQDAERFELTESYKAINAAEMAKDPVFKETIERYEEQLVASYETIQSNLEVINDLLKAVLFEIERQKMVET